MIHLHTRAGTSNPWVACSLAQLTRGAEQCQLELWQVSLWILIQWLKHSPVSSEKHAAVLSLVIKESEKRLQDCQNINFFFCLFATPFSVDLNTLLRNF